MPSGFKAVLTVLANIDGFPIFARAKPSGDARYCKRRDDHKNRHDPPRYIDIDFAEMHGARTKRHHHTEK